MLSGRFSMRPMIFAGLILAGVGAIVLLRGGSFVSPQHLLLIGNVASSNDRQQAIPPWLGGLGVFAGGVLVLAGARRQD
jgi:hypothetical protein